MVHSFCFHYLTGPLHISSPWKDKPVTKFKTQYMTMVDMLMNVGKGKDTANIPLSLAEELVVDLLDE